MKPGMAARYVCMVVIDGEEASRADGEDWEAGTLTTLEAGEKRKAKSNIFSFNQHHVFKATG